MSPDFDTSRRAFFVVSLTVLCSAGVSILSAETPSQHPNVLLILADDI